MRRMGEMVQKIRMRLPALLLLVATLVFWGFYDRYEPVDPALVDAPSLADATSVRGDCVETNGLFTLKVVPGGPIASIHFRLPSAIRYSMLRVKGRIRTEGVVVGSTDWRCARLLLTQYDKNGTWIPGHHGIVSQNGTLGWKRHEDVFEIDATAAHADLVIEQTGTEGLAEFDGLLVEPIRVRPSFVWWRSAFGLSWLGMAVLFFKRCRLDRRRLRVLILLNALVIVCGTLMPETWIEVTTDHVKATVVKVLSAKEHPSSIPASPAAGPNVTAQSKPPAPVIDRERELMDEFNATLGNLHGVGHYLLFASLCFLVYCSAALERQRRVYYAKVALDVLLFAAVTESLQHLTNDRRPGVSDWMIDVYGMVTALLAFLAVRLVARIASLRRRA